MHVNPTKFLMWNVRTLESLGTQTKDSDVGLGLGNLGRFPERNYGTGDSIGGLKDLGMQSEVKPGGSWDWTDNIYGSWLYSLSLSC